MIGFGQMTYVPDDNFEAYLEANGMGNGIANDDYVLTGAIDTLSVLDIYSVIPALLNIADLTGIEAFTALTYLNCGTNQLTSLDLRNDTLLSFYSLNNANLYCIDVDDSIWATNNWTWTGPFPNIDYQHYFSNNCSLTADLQELSINKELLKVTDLLGRKTKGKKNQPLFYLYNDGTVERKLYLD